MSAPRELSERHTAMDTIFSALSLLTPFDIDRPKIRIGPDEDGGYVFADHFSPHQALVSYGVSTEYRLEFEFAHRGHEVFMFDHTIDGIKGSHPRVRFFREGVAGATDQARSLYAIEDHLKRHQIAGDRLILKMDVEGAEFESLARIPDPVLARFEQIVVEVHWLEQLINPNYRAYFCHIFRKLNSIFTLHHVHANNFDGPDALPVIGGFPVARIIELSYIRTSVVTRRRSATVFPTPMDFPNSGTRDKLLWIFPFFPSAVPPEALSRCAERVESTETRRS